MDDMQLVLEAIGGRNGAFDDLVRRHADAAFAFSLRLTGNRADAEDLAQEGFVRAYRSLSRFRGESAFRSWLFSILANCWRDVARARRRVRPGPVDEGTADDRAADDLRALVDRRIEGLPPRQRQVLELHLQGKLDYAGIAAALGITAADVKVNLSLARKRLREELKEVIE